MNIQKFDLDNWWHFAFLFGIAALPGSAVAGAIKDPRIAYIGFLFSVSMFFIGTGWEIALRTKITDDRKGITTYRYVETSWVTYLTSAIGWLLLLATVVFSLFEIF